MGGRASRAAVLVTCAVVVVTGCGSGTDPTPMPSTPQVFVNFTPHVWSAEDRVDLFGRGSELIRAASEAGFYWTAIEEIDDYFPGFTSALGPAEEPFKLARWEDRSEYLAPINETVFMHIADYSETDTVISASVCSYALHSIPGMDDANPPTGVDRIVLENTGGSAGAAGVEDLDPDRGTDAQRSPSWNVFGSWMIRSGKPIFGGTEEAPRDDGLFVPQECRDWWAEKFPELTQPDPHSPYQEQPPGFVAPVIPVGVQFPGWIGPSNVS